MTSTRPYLIRGIYEWAADNGLTPHLLVDTTQEGVTVPTEFIEDNKIILNVSNSAASNLSLGDEFISFSARFAGVSQEIFVPTSAVRAVYARENGMGIVLPEDSDLAETPSNGPVPEPAPRSKPKGPNLTVIK